MSELKIPDEFLRSRTDQVYELGYRHAKEGKPHSPWNTYVTPKYFCAYRAGWLAAQSSSRLRPES